MPPACRKKPEKNGVLLIFSFFLGRGFVRNLASLIEAAKKGGS